MARYENIRFIHNREEAYTIAYEVKGTQKGGLSVRASFAQCGPHDQFCYRVGRDVAAGRLQCPRTIPHRYEFIAPYPHPTKGEEWRDVEGFIEATVVREEVALDYARLRNQHLSQAEEHYVYG